MGQCLGCENEARLSELGFESKLSEAKQYVKKAKTAVKVFKELNEWTFIELSAPGAPAVPGRAVVSWNERTAAVEVH
jgi:hypothetical protein